MSTKTIYQQGDFRIIEIQDTYYSVDDLKGDCFCPETNNTISFEILRQQEIEFENHVYASGVYGYELQYWNTEIDKGWTHVDSCWGFVGAFNELSPKYNHYIVDELKNQIPTRKAV